jgi:hypothetical protein
MKPMSLISMSCWPTSRVQANAILIAAGFPRDLQPPFSRARTLQYASLESESRG